MTWKRLMLGALIVFSVVVGVNLSSAEIKSDAYADVLRGEQYYLRYSTQWLLGDNQVVEVETALFEDAMLLQYDMQGSTIVTSLTETERIRVFLDGSLAQEVENPMTVVSPYQDITFTGVTGQITFEDNVLTYEEYGYQLGDESLRLRFLLDGDALWGLQFDDDTQYVKVLELSESIPDDFYESFTLLR